MKNSIKTLVTSPIFGPNNNTLIMKSGKSGSSMLKNTFDNEIGVNPYNESENSLVQIKEDHL